MPKLSTEKKFIDVSDYGRPIATVFAQLLKNTKTTPIQITFLFGLCGLIAVFCILEKHFLMAGVFLILKSIIDATDGELSRLKKTPSYTGRYLDSVFDIILNFLFLMSICFISQATFLATLLAFVCFQLQGTLYNYYYVILRNNSVGGDSTSKIFETQSPKAFPGESQRMVNFLFTIFNALYSIYDKVIFALDKEAVSVKTLPNWFMAFVSVYGLGFQLLLIAIMLALGCVEIIIPFFIFYSGFIFVFVGIRKTFLN